MDLSQLLRALGLQQAYQSYQQNIGQPFANIAGPFGRGLLGLERPEYGEEQAYRTGQAFGNAPAVKAPVGAFKAAMQAPELLAAMGAIAPKGARKVAEAITEVRTLKNAPQDEALEIARQNAVKMLGLPETNTAMDRARVLAAIDEMDAAKRLHQFGNLEFQAIPLEDFKGKLTYKSPSYNRKQSSEYRISQINNEPVLMRKSDHWGKFSTNIKEEDQIYQQIKDLINTMPDDAFGRVGKNIQNWQLIGGISQKNADKIAELEMLANALPVGSNERYALYDQIYKLTHPKKSEAGYIPVSKLIGKIPEKTAFIDASAASNAFEVPFVTLKNNNLRSRFAAFDPARIDAKDLLASLAAMGIALPVGMGLLSEQTD